MKQKTNKQLGFSLIELMVALSIFAILTGVFLAKNQNFGNQILLENLTYDVALSIREAQVFGLSVKETELAPDNFNIAYGVRLESETSDKDNTTYYLFADINDNGQYDQSPVDETVETFSLRNGFKIGEICGSAAKQGCQETTEWLDILFKRPEPDALIVSDNGRWIYATIKVVSSRGRERIVQVLPSGQISVQDPVIE